MPGVLPIGDPAPADGLLPDLVVEGAEHRDFGVYLHVPFCRVRCGYCDFNTYTAQEIRGVRQNDYTGHARHEIELADGVLTGSGLPARPATTVFFGGGTPTLLPVTDLVSMFDAVRDTWGLAHGAEVTTEANPDSVDAAYLQALSDAGFTRVSFGMQSAVPEVLATLERTHDPQRVPLVVGWARDAGLEVSLDLIYGTPGETLENWRASLEAALTCEPDHLSTYALIIEPGTKLARQIRRGEVAEPSDDLQADMYELADQVLDDAGFDWYEVSNWAHRDPEAAGSSVRHRSRHNLAYWRGQDWWGVGPGAHSHIGGVRWWNVKHPAAYADRLTAGLSPAAGRETLDLATQRLEQILLLSRIREGIAIDILAESVRPQVPALIAEGLIDGRDALTGHIVLTLTGRLLADLVVRRLTED
ncbi:radical SAM family heme chaperone HemW [Homoserinimonas sp. OAct 916]|uniref:radical SAM family heme chaperone HemW n=1 Tax=Homoserinimonas sp. OAct 916 TaxID=2211450 RepID=UPI000DBE2646|nr:radical SAM family heme chaperone HemW [Homoserinimonas sp. OAct 916]